MANSDTPAIEVAGLCNRFGDNVVHDGLDLVVQRGEIYGVVGGSGTGKSVLLRSIIGLNRPSAGSIRLLGSDTAGLGAAARSALEQRFGVLFQNGALFSSLTVLENIAFPLIEHCGLPRRDAGELAALKLSLAGLPDHAAQRYPAELSGGMVKRASLARALAMDPELLFLDEPTARPHQRRRVRQSHPHPAGRFRANYFHGHPRPGYPVHNLRPGGSAGPAKSADC